VDVQGQGLFAIGEIDFVLPPVSEAQTITVTLQLPHTHNSYTFRQYPVQEMPAMQSDEVLCITHDLPEAMQALAEGRRVLFLPESLTEKVRGFYCADFWCYPMFRSISESMGKEVPVGTLGLCIDNAHPALQGFASERWSTPQWYDLVTHSDLAVLDGTDVQPIVQMIDNFERNHKLGLLFEYTVGQGRLLVCTARLDEITDRMEVRQFARGLLAYARSDAFAPKAALTMEQAEKILR
ncbi:MAG: beta-glucuronidase, partial [Oscillospiraceae bacterium]|nr:beta-glucuronidase [Oscillospiraceae bacterium]